MILEHPDLNHSDENFYKYFVNLHLSLKTLHVSTRHTDWAGSVAAAEIGYPVKLARLENYLRV